LCLQAVSSSASNNHLFVTIISNIIRSQQLHLRWCSLLHLRWCSLLQLQRQRRWRSLQWSHHHPHRRLLPQVNLSVQLQRRPPACVVLAPMVPWLWKSLNLTELKARVLTVEARKRKPFVYNHRVVVHVQVLTCCPSQLTQEIKEVVHATNLSLLVSTPTLNVPMDGMLKGPMAAHPTLALTTGKFKPLVSTVVVESTFIRPAAVILGCVPFSAATLFLDTNFLTRTTKVIIQHGIMQMAGKFISLVNCTSNVTMFCMLRTSLLISSFCLQLYSNSSPVLLSHP
jgi:hypothetical protein